MGDIKTVLEKVVSYQQKIKAGKKSKKIKLSDKPRTITTIYVPSVTI